MPWRGVTKTSVMRAFPRPARRLTAAQRRAIGAHSSPAHPERVGLRTPRAHFAAGLTGGALMLRREGGPHRVWSRARSAEGAEEDEEGARLPSAWSSTRRCAASCTCTTRSTSRGRTSSRSRRRAQQARPAAAGGWTARLRRGACARIGCAIAASAQAATEQTALPVAIVPLREACLSEHEG